MKCPCKAQNFLGKNLILLAFQSSYADNEEKTSLQDDFEMEVAVWTRTGLSNLDARDVGSSKARDKTKVSWTPLPKGSKHLGFSSWITASGN